MLSLRQDGSVTSLGRTLSVATAALAIVVMSGCGADNRWEVTSPGAPEGLELDPLSDAPTATWIERGESFAIVTMGSSSCPPVATDLEAKQEDQVVVTFAPSPNELCTADMAPTTHQFELPDGITGTQISVEIVYEDWPETHSFTLE